MSCILTSINDATLKNLILKYGAEEGLKQHIKNIEVFEKVLKNYRKEVSSEQQTNIKKRIKEYNEQNNTGYYVNFTQVGQANLYTWELENKRPPALYNAPPKVTYPYKIGVNQWRTEEGDIISQADALMELKSKNVEYSINPETPIKPGVEEFKNWIDGGNNQIKYQLPQGRELEEYVASEKTIRDLAARISDRIGVPVKFESDRTKKYKGKIENNIAYINLAYATLDTAIHEVLGHSIIRALKSKSNLSSKEQLNQQVEQGNIEKKC